MYRIGRDEVTFTQYNYFLKWDDESKDSTWSLFDLDQKNGTFALVTEGEGWEQYLKTLTRLGMSDMSAHMVAFGGCPSDDAIKRLGLTNENVSQLKGCGNLN